MSENEKRKRIEFLVKAMKYEDSEAKIQTIETDTASIVKKEIKLPTGEIFRSFNVYPVKASETVYVIKEPVSENFIPPDISGLSSSSSTSTISGTRM